jgi:hypothetical protein
MAASLAMLGFDPADGDLPAEEPVRATAPNKRRLSSSTGRNRRGERRSRNAREGK